MNLLILLLKEFRKRRTAAHTVCAHTNNTPSLYLGKYALSAHRHLITKIQTAKLFYWKTFWEWIQETETARKLLWHLQQLWFFKNNHLETPRSQMAVTEHRIRYQETWVWDLALTSDNTPDGKLSGPLSSPVNQRGAINSALGFFIFNPNLILKDSAL